MITKRSILFLWLGLMFYASFQALLVAKSGSAPFLGVFLYNLISENFRLVSILAMLWLSGRYMHNWHIRRQILVYAVWVIITSIVLIVTNLGVVYAWGRTEAFHSIWNSKHWIFLQNVLEDSLLIAGFVVMRFRHEIKAREEREKELQHLNTQMELVALRAQINPHFLFNALNAVNALVGANPDEARRVLEMLSDLLRYTLESDKQEMVRLQEELDFVRKYLAIEQARFGKRLQYRIETDETILGELIPPMLLQPLVENAVKHGISPKASGGEVCVSVMRDETGKGLVVEVRDNGVGIQPNSHVQSTGIGLANVHSRLQKLFGEKASFEIHDSPSGVGVRFSLPLQTSFPIA